MKYVFWVFMLAVALLVPATMIGFGGRFRKAPPARINAAFGYRSARSMKNRDTWVFAHRYFGALWVRFGWAALIVTVPAMAVSLLWELQVIGWYTIALEGIQLVLVLIPVFMTESQLKKTFDKNGKRLNAE